MFLEISQNSQENTCARVSFLIKLQAYLFYRAPRSNCFWINSHKKTNSRPFLCLLKRIEYWLSSWKNLSFPKTTCQKNLGRNPENVEIYCRWYSQWELMSGNSRTCSECENNLHFATILRHLSMEKRWKII